MEAHKLEQLSFADYLKIEQETNTRYEYHDGRVFAMAGGTVEHGLISGNVFGEIKFALRQRGRKCTVLNNDVKLHIVASNKYLYPDVMVIYGDLERSPQTKDAIVNPVVIIEVLLESTANYDRGDKFYFYRQIESLQEYILIDQEKPQIDSYQRQAGLWKISRTEGLEASLRLAALEEEIPLAQIYEQVFPKQ